MAAKALRKHVVNQAMEECSIWFFLQEQELNLSSLLPNTTHLQEQRIYVVWMLQRHQCGWALNPFPAEEVSQEEGAVGSSMPARHHQIVVAGGLLPVPPNNKQEGHHLSVNCAAEGQHLKRRYMWQGTWITVICFVSLPDLFFFSFFLGGIKK